ncbi:hypothetical protein NP233_g1979 [Leucocoprinus birnbaumii]|uniref:Uncharacterized protein n=1 Tax=Leucocoprinus birnbaumii TaxID=56174 RepID=A0AAD5VZ25_9AGAR|nr:hypothetical protein NP233_g1979 [Leucocoprinus birnbaumii]
MLYLDYRRGDQPKQMKILGVQSFVILSLTAISFAPQTKSTIWAYVDYNDDSGEGPPTYENSTVPERNPALVWFSIISLPVADILIAITEVRAIIGLTRHGDLIFTPRVGAFGSYGQVWTASPYAFYVVVGWFLPFVAVLGGTLCQPSTEFTGIVAMLTESYALSALASIAILVSWLPMFDESPARAPIGILADYMSVIANYLLLYRILSRRAWNRNTERELTSLQWARESANPTASVAEALPEITTRSLSQTVSGT